jgi:hypothetical protein
MPENAPSSLTKAAPVDADRIDILSLEQRVDHFQRPFAANGVELVGIEVAGVVDTDDLAFGGDERAAGVAVVDHGVVLDDPVDRRPVGLAVGTPLWRDPQGEGLLGVTQRKPGGVDIQPRP